MAKILPTAQQVLCIACEVVCTIILKVTKLCIFVRKFTKIKYNTIHFPVTLRLGPNSRISSDMHIPVVIIIVVVSPFRRFCFLLFLSLCFYDLSSCSDTINDPAKLS